MRTTVTLDDELLNSAREYVGDVDTPTLLRMALTALIQREAARRLAALGGSGPDFDIPPRRRSAS
jgi:Arc/MetJ family transcription regulator